MLNLYLVHLVMRQFSVPFFNKKFNTIKLSQQNLNPSENL